MIVKVDLLLKYLRDKDISKEDFAKKLCLSTDELNKLLEGQAVGFETAKKFINGLSADVAQHLIDWNKLGIVNPLQQVDGSN